MTNLDLFNPLNRDHLREFEHLAKTGVWSNAMIEFFGDVEYALPIAFYGKVATVLVDVVLHNDSFADIELQWHLL